MDKLQQISETILFVLNKNRKGHVKPAEINLAIQAAERDLYDELFQTYRKTSVLPKKLEPFKTRVTDLNLDVSGELIIATLKELLAAEFEYTSTEGLYKAAIARTDEQWGSRPIEQIVNPERPDKPLTEFVKGDTIVGDDSTVTKNLSPYFIKCIGAYISDGTDKFKAFEVTPENWGSRKLSDLIPDPERPDDPLFRNISEVEYTEGQLSSGSSALPVNFIKEISAKVVIGGINYEVYFVSPEDFNSRKFKDLVNDGEIKTHLNVVEESIALTSGSGVLPDGFIKDKGVFYYEYGGEKFEGIILDSEEYLDRVNSVILTPTEEEPVARIVGGSIEVSPSSISDIDLTFYKFPTSYTPVATIIGDSIHIYPTIAVGTTLDLRYYEHPIQSRPVYKIEGDVITVDPAPASGSTFYFSYLAFPTEKKPIARTIGTSIIAQPAAVTISTDITYLAELVPCEYVVTTSGRDVTYNDISHGTFPSTDTTFGIDAINDIVAKALKYLGVAIQSPTHAQFEQIKDGNNAEKDI